MRDNICVLNGAPDPPQSSLARAAWMTVAGICVIAALILLLNNNDGYSADAVSYTNIRAHDTPYLRECRLND
jgi:hypothetical protein